MFKRIFSPGLFNFWLFISFSLGIISGYYFPYFAAFIILFLLSVALVFFFYRRRKFPLSDISVAALFFSLGALWYLPYSYQDTDKFLGEENIFILKASSMPRETPLRNILLVDIKNINGVNVTRQARAIDYSKTMDYLNNYKAKARLSRVTIKDRDFYTLWVKSNEPVEKIPLNFPDKLNKKAAFQFLKTLKSNLSDESYRFIASVFLGRRELLNRGEKDAFTNAGISHLLAISGSNIGLTALVLFFIFKLFNIKFRACLLFSVFFLFAYAFIIGANPPTVRAVIMYSAFSLSFFVKRKLNPFNSLGLAGFFCLLINPSWLFDVGFQLSFLSIFSLILGFKIFPIKQSNIGFLNQLQYLFFSSLYVTILIAPLISYYFERIYILSIFNNILLIPFFTLILIINFALLIFSPFNLIAQSIGEVLSMLIPLFYKLSHFLGSIKFSFITCQFSLGMVFMYYVFLVGLIFLLKFYAKAPSFKWFDKIKSF
ncbi:MAG: ComEC/Rec2 family competence protein [Candidatus Omnitrophica bacterium]|nr:ComEC/Rec2 family competence protein [Candidatus Omnitrophota bacterium]